MYNYLSKIFIVALSVIFFSCGNKFKSDASGVFEVDEVVVSAQQAGQILSLNIQEGKQLKTNEQVGQIDITDNKLKAEQIEAQINALNEKTGSPQDQLTLIQNQLAVQESQQSQLLKDQQRITNLYNSDAATKKQFDDINAAVDQIKKQIAVTKQQLAVTTYNVNQQNKVILSEKAPMQKSLSQVQNLIAKGEILSPINGTVLTQFAFAGEMATIGKPLFSIANLDTLNLKAYISGDQLDDVKLGQEVNVLIDKGKKEFKTYKGVLAWVSDKSEFTPKSIQTKDERANLVYAIKIRVVNDGYLKIGMYGEVRFK